MVLRPCTALRRNPPCIVGKERAMIRLGVRVAMAVRGGHEGDVLAQKIARIVASGLVHRPQEHANAQEIQGVVAALQALVVVPVGLAPEVLLAVQNDAADHFAFLGAASGTSRAGQRHDRTGMEVARCLEIADDAEIPLQGRHVVVPVDGHGQRIAHEHAPQRAPPTVEFV